MAGVLDAPIRTLWALIQFSIAWATVSYFIQHVFLGGTQSAIISPLAALGGFIVCLVACAMWLGLNLARKLDCTNQNIEMADQQEGDAITVLDELPPSMINEFALSEDPADAEQNAFSVIERARMSVFQFLRGYVDDQKSRMHTYKNESEPIVWKCAHLAEATGATVQLIITPPADGKGLPPFAYSTKATTKAARP